MVSTAMGSVVAGPHASSHAVAPFLQLSDVRKAFGRRLVLDSISLNIERGEFLTILGESGSGKTTLLRIIGGFEEATSGSVLLDGSALQNLPPYRRPVNTVFQNYALFPHLSVFDNVAYGLRVQKTPRHEIADRVTSALRMVRMESYAHATPRTISGGQKQRVALARALVNRPKALLLDEPLSALDANLRGEMQKELKLLQQQLGITFLFVTHDQDEAMAMSDRIVLLHRGRIEQCGTPRDIYLSPRTRYVAEFIGKSNVISATVVNGIADCGVFSFPSDAPDGKVLYSLRPECIRLPSQASEQHSIHFSAKVEVQQFHGASVLLSLRCDDETVLTARLPASSLPLGGVHTPEFVCSPQDLVRLENS